MYKIWNDTDDISASMKSFKTTKLAEDEIVRLRDGFRIQGYYRDSRWNKVPPDEIEYRIYTHARGSAARRTELDSELI